jgi:LPXTG-motif cell wall-anchored protein
MPEFMSSWTFMIIMGLALIGLIIVLLVLRNKRSDE